MKFKVVGAYPEPLLNHVLHLYDANSDERKIAFLTGNRPLGGFKPSNERKEFTTGKTVDLSASEVLGISLVALHYNVLGERNGDTYQVVVGLEDSVGAQKENYLSDGAIWHDQRGEKMVFQQVMAQGYQPKDLVTAQSIAEQINKKAARRSDYPDNCGLIVNIFSESFAFTFNRVAMLANLAAFTVVYLVLYQMPTVSRAIVVPISVPEAPDFPVELKRHPTDGRWHFNT